MSLRLAWLGQFDEKVREAKAAFARQPSPQTFEAYRVAVKSGADQRDLSVASLFSKEDNERLAVGLSGANNPAEELEKYRGIFGSSFQEVMAGVLPKAPNRINILANDVPPKTVKLVMDASRDPDFAKKAEAALNLSGTSKSDFDAILREQLADFNATLHAAGKLDMANEIFATSRLAALQYMATQGLNPQEAAERAAKEIILDRYHIAKNRNSESRYRIPKSLPVDLVEKGCEEWLDRVDLSKLSLRLDPVRDRKMEGKALESYIRQNGRWVTNGNETGLQLFVGSIPVQFKKGGDVIVPWEDFALAGQAIAEKTEAILAETEDF